MARVASSSEGESVRGAERLTAGGEGGGKVEKGGSDVVARRHDGRGAVRNRAFRRVVCLSPSSGCRGSPLEESA